jgi:hypothetical protein
MITIHQHVVLRSVQQNVSQEQGKGGAEVDVVTVEFNLPHPSPLQTRAPPSMCTV